MEVMILDKIRNFGIIAHVNHGKSTLADRLMQLTHVITSEEKEQYLDKLQVYYKIYFLRYIKTYVLFTGGKRTWNNSESPNMHNDT